MRLSGMRERMERTWALMLMMRMRMRRTEMMEGASLGAAEAGEASGKWRRRWFRPP